MKFHDLTELLLYTKKLKFILLWKNDDRETDMSCLSEYGMHLTFFKILRKMPSYLSFLA